MLANYKDYSVCPCSLRTSGKLMELGHDDGRLRVHYDDRLVTLIREVRQLTGLGYVIPAKIQNTADTGQKFYKQAVILKQVRPGIVQDSFHSIMHLLVFVYSTGMQICISTPNHHGLFKDSSTIFLARHLHHCFLSASSSFEKS